MQEPALVIGCIKRDIGPGNSAEKAWKFERSARQVQKSVVVSRSPLLDLCEKPPFGSEL